MTHGKSTRHKNRHEQDNACVVFEKVGRKLKDLKKDAAEAEGGGGGGLLAGLKGGLGRGSTFGQTANILRGGGAVLGLTIAGRELKALSDQAVVLQKELADDSKSGGQVAEELAKSIPIFGNIIGAGRTFRSILDGSAAAIFEINKSTERQTVVIDTLTAANDRMHEEQIKAANELRDIQNQTNLVGLVDPTKTLLDLEQQRLKVRDQLAQKVKEETKTIEGAVRREDSGTSKAIRPVRAGRGQGAAGGGRRGGAGRVRRARREQSSTPAARGRRRRGRRRGA